MRMKAKDAAALFGVMRDMRLSGIEAPDRMKVIRTLRALRAAADKYAGDLELARERLKPEGFDALAERARAGGAEEAALFKRAGDAYARDMKAFMEGTYDPERDAFSGGLDDEECDVPVEALDEGAFGKLAEANGEMSAGALTLLYETAVKKGEP